MNSLTSYILRRLLMIPVTLFGVTLIVFAIIRAAPGGGVISDIDGGGNMNAKQLADMQRELRIRKGLEYEDGTPVPYPIQYGYWLSDMWNSGLGYSVRHKCSVAELLSTRLPITLSLNITAFAITYIIAIPLGLLSAVQHNRPFDRGVTVVSFLLYSMPAIWVGSLFLKFLANREFFDWFPAAQLHSSGAGRLPFLEWMRDLLWHAVLPLATMTYASFAYLSKQMRAGMLENLRQDYVRTARAKGLGGSAVVLRHAFRNSIIPIITVLGTVLPSMIAGSIIVERIFSIQGMGWLTFEAVQSRDFAVIQTMTAIAGTLNMIGLLLADIAYAIADPRISYD